MIVRLESNSHCGKVYRLTRPVKVKIGQEHSLHTIDFSHLGIHEYGETEQEAREAFAEHFCSMYGFIALADDAKLAPEARVLKKKVLSLVARVEQAPGSAPGISCQ